MPPAAFSGLAAGAAPGSALAPYASDPARSRGRRHPEVPAPTRSAFQRDRDRVIHCSAFRRLVYKTQVFLNHEGDLFRTRLTHSLEVAQLGRSIARALQLNEDLVEAIALAHDLGHTPFGHAGQDALHACMREQGGFEHNLQSLRVVDELEERYPAFDGLNLSFETREGILKHCSAAHARQLQAREPDGVARRFLDGTQPSLEAQLANLADEIAYNAHDIDDGVRSGLLTLDQLDEVALFRRFRDQTLAEHPAARGKRLLFDAIRRMLSQQVYDVIDATQAALARHGPSSADEARQCPPLVAFSDDMRELSSGLKRFLFRNLYRHPQVNESTDRARLVVAELFAAYLNDPDQVPAHFAPRGADDYAGSGLDEGSYDEPMAGAGHSLPRRVADYIAGMTDRFAIREHERLTGRRLFER